MITSVKYESNKKQGRSELVVNYSFRTNFKEIGPAGKIMAKKRMSTQPREGNTKCIYDYFFSKGFYGGNEGIFENQRKDRRITVEKRWFSRMRITAEAWESGVSMEDLLDQTEVNGFIISGAMPS